jgi:hypothetical protein
VRVLKTVSLYLAYPLCVLVNKCLQRCLIPRCLKESRVIPLHKSGSMQSVSNYRPIFLQSIFMTIIEKATIQNAIVYTRQNSVISDNQFGFKLNHSCMHACLYHLSSIYGYADAGLKVGCLYVDIKNAFPSVDHDVLLQILHANGCLGLPYDWFRTYISDRRMYVDVANSNSDCVPVTRGVPQGSIFGPLLFNVYYNGISSKFEPRNVTLFADDTAIVSSATNTPGLLHSMQQSLSITYSHLAQLRMELNASKTQFMIFRSADTTMSLSVEGQTVKQCTAFKYLGVYIDSDLKWNTHVCKLILKVQKMLYVLHRCSGKSNADKLPILFRSYIFPHFVYGIQLYMFCSVSNRAKLESLFRRCCRLVIRDNGWPPLIDNKSLYYLLDVLPLRLLFQYTSAVMLYKIIVLRQIPALLSLFTTVDRSSRLVPDSVIVLRVPAVSLESSRHSFAYWGAKLWNVIPASIRHSPSLQLFSKSYLDYLKMRLPDVSTDRYDILDFV